ncbi:hypothetical protein AG1IA_07073 [Rhizoctonia solani AG-1 IA]|uniref:Uncharacterized protein n=1 Tax=Thanatephorus cucumeris (strain AG1-IA) TaxID=983506 RepID=L8WLS3_THACA|nr:hypothetical protein AG1IA_07073 [Rhizoctonia solani AG-1 IA]
MVRRVSVADLIITTIIYKLPSSGVFVTKPKHEASQVTTASCRVNLRPTSPSGLAHTECRGTPLAGLGRPATSQNRCRARPVHPRCFAAAGAPQPSLLWVS